ncbi:hypothetical protein RYX36_032865 [Vicia faba]
MSSSSCSRYPIMNNTLFSLFFFVLIAKISFFFTTKVYVVYMGSKNGEHEHPDDILKENHQILASVHSGSIELAQASHVYSYNHGFRGFAAKLNDEQASQVSKITGVVSVVPNSKRKLHTTHSWDFTFDILLGNRAKVTGEILSLFEMNTSSRIILASQAFVGYFTPYQSSYCLESSLNKTKTVIGAQPAPRIAAFSSRGPNALSPEILKSDITAPGINILAAWSLAIGNMFNILSGTSMACPHVTRIATLVKVVHPSWSPSAIKSAFMTTAIILDKSHKPISVDPEQNNGPALPVWPCIERWKTKNQLTAQLLIQNKH